MHDPSPGAATPARISHLARSSRTASGCTDAARPDHGQHDDHRGASTTRRSSPISVRRPVTLDVAELLLNGLWYSGTILLILGAHELGHYLACRYYQVDASLPFFIPMPHRRSPARSVRSSKSASRFRPSACCSTSASRGRSPDFSLRVPALFIGVAMSPVVTVPRRSSRDSSSANRCSSRAAAWLIWGSIPDGYSLNLHPMAFAAWFGLLATALNLFPIGQLDGGHISYAVLGRRSTAVTIGSICVAIGLTFFSTSWIVWTFLLRRDDARHGPTPSADDRRRHPARSPAHLARSGRAGHSRYLLHLQPDRADRLTGNSIGHVLTMDHLW